MCQGSLYFHIRHLTYRVQMYMIEETLYERRTSGVFKGFQI